MPDYKLTYIFGVPKNGWTETWYTNATSHAIAQTRAINYANARVNLTGSNVELEAIRISDEAIDGDALLITQGFTRSLTQLQATPRNGVWVAWDTRWQATPLYRRNLLLRGIPDLFVEYTAAGIEQPPPGLLVQSFSNLVQSAITNQLALRVNRRQADNPRVQIQFIQPSPNGLWEITAPPGLLIQGQFCRIYDVQDDIPGLQGRQQIRTVGTPTAYETYAPSSGTALYNGLALVRPEIINYEVVTTGVLLRIAKRDTGRRFFVTRGRARART